MSTTTTANPQTLAQQATTPILRHFQMDTDVVGAVQSSLNLFAGKVGLPIELISLKGRGGLNIDLSLSYSSDVAYAVNTWNLEAPTGVLGLGWSLEGDVIERDVNGSLSPYDDTYFIRRADGSVTALHLLAREPTLWSFEAEDYDFSRISYDPAADLWRIQTIDGLTRVFGDNDNARQRGVGWGGERGNWTGPSIQDGQTSYTLAWNLSRVLNPYGDAATYAYSDFSDDEIQIGGARGLTYTRAKYLARITEPSGREIRFIYGNKRHDDAVREYVPPHVEAGELKAYQDRYETRFLDRIELYHPGNSAPSLQIRFTYDLERYSRAPGEPSSMVKRYLTGFALVNEVGKILPGMRFSYETRSEAEYATGALVRAVFPNGAVVDYRHERRDIGGASLSHVARRDETGAGTPRVWIGPNYSVILRYDAVNSRRLVVSVYDWNGRWLPSRPIDLNLEDGLDLDTLLMDLQDEFFVLAFRVSGGAGPEKIWCRAVRRRFGQYGVWDATPLDLPALPRPGAAFDVVAADHMVLCAVEDRAEVRRYAWNPRTLSWDPSSMPTGGGGAYKLTAAGALGLVARLDPFTGRTELTLVGFEPGPGVFRCLALESFAATDHPDAPAPAYVLGTTYAAAIFITSIDEAAKQFDYESRLYSWDRFLENPVLERQFYPGLPIETEAAYLSGAASDSLFGNAQNLARFNGSVWVKARLGDFSQASHPLFAYGPDLAVAGSGEDTVAMAYRPETDAFLPASELRYAQGPHQPSIAGNYVTVGSRLYHRETDGSFRYLKDLPPDAERIANDGDRFVAYAYPDGRTYVLLLRNGLAADAAELVVGRGFTSDDDAPGRFLFGPTAFATYLGPDFDSAEEIRLYRCLHGRVSGGIPDYVVVEARLSTRPGLEQITRLDYPATGTTGPFGLGAHYAEVVVSRGEAEDPKAFGYERHVFFDGLTPPEAGEDRPYGLFNGLLRRKDAFDASDRLLMADAYDWTAIRLAVEADGGAERRLFGAFVRPVRTTTTYYDPLQPDVRLDQWVESRFDPANGLLALETSNNIDAAGQAQRLERRLEYAFTRYPELSPLNWLDGQALETRSVDGVVIRREATLWSSQWNGAITAPAISRRLLARASDAELSPAQWAGQAPPGSDWRVVETFTRRDRFGAPVGGRDATGLDSSVQMDREGRFVVASWVGADVARGQALYVGFEPYEDLSGWRLSGGDPAAGVVSDDTHCGRGALRLAPGQILDYAAPIIDPLARVYAVSAWIKTTATAQGVARLSLSIAGATVDLDLNSTQGDWAHVVALLDKPADPQARDLMVRITAAEEEPVWIDDLWFGPAACPFRATVWDRLYRPTDSFTNSGQTQRKLYGDYDDPALEVDALEALVTLRAPLRAWPAPDGVEMRWNSLLTIKPQTFGGLQRLRLGADWSTNWTGDTAQFIAQDGLLRHQTSTPSLIAYGDLGDTEGGWFIAARARPDVERASGTYGLQAAGYRLSCDEASAGWSLREADGADLAWASFAPLFDLPAEVIADLDAGRLGPLITDRMSRNGAPLGDTARVDVLTPGQRWRVRLSPDTSAAYELVLRNGQVAVLRRDTDLLLLVIDQTLVGFADGRRLFGHTASNPLSVSAGLHASTRVSFDNLGLGTHNQIAIDYQDGALLAHQSQVVGDAHIVASQRFYDVRGRAAVSSQGALLDPTSDLLALSPDLAHFDWTSLRLSGRVAEQNPQSGDFAYVRSRYEASPLGRTVQEGLPGADFAIPPDGGDGRTLRTRYGLSDGRFGEAVGAYRLEEITSADGQKVVRLTDLRDQLVLEAAFAGGASPRWDQSRRRYDPAGRLVALQSPMGWEDRFDFDFIGQRIGARHANDTADRRFIYDAAGRVRFSRLPDGDSVAAPYFKWTKYDLYSRVIAEGVMAGAWDETALKAHAEDPDWPAAASSLQTDYDGLWRGDLLAVGMPARRRRGLQQETVSETADLLVEDERFYDIWAQTVAQTHRLAEAGLDRSWRTDYGYDNQGKPISLQYPALDDDSGLELAQTYDRVGRISRLDFEEHAQKYDYDNNGLLARETWTRPDKSQLVRNLAYNSAGWPVSILDPGFEQRLTYVDGGLDGAGWFTGRPASIRVEARGDAPAWALRLGYDDKGALSGFAIDSGDRQIFRYDRNGNALQFGDVEMTYADAGRDKVQTAGEAGTTSQFTYRKDGAVAVRAGGDARGDLTVGYDVFNAAALRVVRGDEDQGLVQQMRYDAAGLRVLRRVLGGETVYARSLQGDALVEVDSAGARRFFIYGPSGPALMCANGEWTYLSRDSVGSVRGVLNAHSELLAGYDYLPFGAALRVFGPQAAASPYRFVARELDPVALYDLRARFYDPSIGRFLSQDPKFQQASPYLYAGNTPLLLEDPDGEELFALLFGLIAAATIIKSVAIGAAIGAAVGAAAGVIGAAVEIASRDLEGGEAAGVFFGFVGLGVASGAIAGALTGGAGSALQVFGASTIQTVAVSTTVGAATGGVLGAAESAGQAALLGEDPGAAAWTGSISSAVSGAVGAFLTEAIPAASVARAARNARPGMPAPEPNKWVVFGGAAVGGAVGGATSGAVAGGLNGDSSADILTGALQSAGIGLLGALPELRKKPWSS